MSRCCPSPRRRPEGLRPDGIHQPALREPLDVQGSPLNGSVVVSAGKPSSLSLGILSLPGGTCVCRALSTRNERILARGHVTALKRVSLEQGVSVTILRRDRAPKPEDLPYQMICLDLTVLDLARREAREKSAFRPGIPTLSDSIIRER